MNITLKLCLSTVFAACGVANAFAFDQRQIAEAREMAELSARLNGDGTPEMDTPDELAPKCGDWTLTKEGKADQAGRKHFGFPAFGNRWAAYKSSLSTQKNTYVIVVRGTIEDKDSMKQDAYVTTAPANRIFFQDRPAGISGAVIKLADDDEAEVHSGFAAGLVDVLFHKPNRKGTQTDQTDTRQGLLAFLQSIEDNSTIYITGHSQGAGLATLLHSFLLHRDDDINKPYLLGQKHFKLYSYVFAQPKPGDSRFAMDFLRSLGKDNDGTFAYVINNKWDWVPQTPMTIQWPSELAELLQKSRSGNTGTIEGLGGWYVAAQKLFRQGFYYAANNHVNKAFHGELDKTYFDGSTPATKEFRTGSSLNYTIVGTIIPLPLDAPKTEKDRPGFSTSAPQISSVTLQHHLWVYLAGLDKMKQDLQTAGHSPVPLPHACDETSRKMK
jgi:hypothetical protein